MKRPQFIPLCLMLVACGPHEDGSSGRDAGSQGTIDLSVSEASAPLAVFQLAPLDSVLTVATGQPLPTVTYVATFAGQPVSAAFTLDKGGLGTLDPVSGLFTAGQLA